MPDPTIPYPGDATLERLLRAHGSAFDVAGVRELVRGVLGAAESVDPASWCNLVVPRPSAELVAALRALQLELAAALPALPPPAMRLAAIRAELRRQDLDAFVFVRGDAHNREYLPKCSERLAWATGFGGSIGWAAITRHAAALFVDPIYVLQAAAQTDRASWSCHDASRQPAGAWLAAQLGPGMVLGYDAWLMTPVQVESVAAAAAASGATCRAVTQNPVDAAWIDRPAQPLGPVVAHPLRFAGRTSADKRAEIAAALAASGQDVAVLTTTESTAWLLNIRGSDVRHTPLALCFALIDRAGDVALFVDRRKLMPGIEAHLGAAVALHPVEQFGAALDGLTGKQVRVDPATVPAGVIDRLRAAGAFPIAGMDPCIVPRATKNEAELAGARACHVRDGVAMVRFLAWLDRSLRGGTVTELQALAMLDGLRLRAPGNRGLSFPTISAAGAHAALPHYAADDASDTAIPPDSLYLVDSGGQYEDGTTDITRTIAVGRPDALRCDRYTRVLKGHIALARAVFAEGTTGHQLDGIPRQALWQVGAEYRHGTGHGVGSHLGVHEGPGRIGPVQPTHPLLAGMVTSIEPGYYRAGSFGIRIENLYAVVPVALPEADCPMLGFEVLTRCPIDTRPILRSMLDAAEIAWLDGYHAATRTTLLPLLDDPVERAWLERATAPLAA